MSDDPWCGWSVQQTATNSTENNDCQSLEIKTEQYIAREFSKLQESNLESACISIPPTFEKSSNPDTKLGEEAEETVYNMLKNSQIPGLKILFFNGQRYIGRKDLLEDSEIVREKDFSIFLEFDGRYFIIFVEVKCCDKQNKDHRKKATSQLRDHCKVLKTAHSIQEKEVSRILLHTAWPRLKREYTCDHCSQQHAVYQRVPEGCPRNNQAQPEYEAAGWHLFKENLESQQKFNKWLKHYCLLKGKAMEQASWRRILKIHTQYACGALYEELSKKFLLLGMDQVKLRDSPKHELNKPKFVSGIAGTGKTVTVCAKIEQLFKKCEVNQENKVLYICFSDPLIASVEDNLKRLEFQIDMDLIEFRNYKTCINIQNFFLDKDKLHQIIFEDNFRYIFFDEAEDLGVEQISHMIRSVLENQKDNTSGYFPMKYPIGHFWILFDVFQSDVDIHGLSVIGDKRSTLRWDGKYIDQNLVEEGQQMGVIVPLRTVFRMTRNILKHIQEKKLNPNLVNIMDQGIEGPVVVTRPPVSIGQDDEIPNTLVQILVTVMTDVFKRNIHNGEVAILFDDKDIGLVLSAESAGLDAIVTLLNKSLKDICKKQKKLAPEVTRSIDNESILNPHSDSLLRCKCKSFLGFVDEVKGLTVKMVVYVPFFRSDGISPLFVDQSFVSRTSPYYKAVSRSSCEVQIQEIILKDELLQKRGIPLVKSPTVDNHNHKETIFKYKKGNSTKPLVVKRQ